MVTKAIVFCDRCGVQMKPILINVKDQLAPKGRDFYPQCKKEYDNFMNIKKQKEVRK